jgi:hypothetical protein
MKMYKLNEMLPAGVGYNYICIPKTNGCEGCGHESSHWDCRYCGKYKLIKRKFTVDGKMESLAKELREAADKKIYENIKHLLVMAADHVEENKHQKKLMENMRYIASADNLCEPCGWAVNTAKSVLKEIDDER